MALKMWMRKIRITLTSTLTGSLNHSITFGDGVVNDIGGYGKKIESFDAQGNPTGWILNKTKNIPTISISGTKYLSSLKDGGLITIYNVDNETMIKIVNYKMFDIRVEIGYNGGSYYTLFEGGVSYISQKKHSNHDCICYITYASKLVASYSQSRINFSILPGMTVYQAYNVLASTQGIKAGILNELKYVKLGEHYTTYDSATNIIEDISSQASLSNTLNGTINFSTDSTDGDIVSLFTNGNDRKNIIIDNKTIPIAESNPRISSDGLTMKLLPTYQFRAGDVITIDNSLVDASIQNNVQSTFTSTFLDNGEYVQNNKYLFNKVKNTSINNPGSYLIYEIKYNIENRGEKFEYEIRARAMSLVQNLLNNGA